MLYRSSYNQNGQDDYTAIQAAITTHFTLSRMVLCGSRSSITAGRVGHKAAWHLSGPRRVLMGCNELAENSPLTLYVSLFTLYYPLQLIWIREIWL